MNATVQHPALRAVDSTPVRGEPQRRAQRKADAMQILPALIAANISASKVERLCIESYRLADLMESLADLSDRELMERRSRLGLG